MCKLITKLTNITPKTNSLVNTYINVSGPGSSVGIATDYGLDGPGIESRWGRDFSHTWASESYPGVKRPGRGADHPPPPSAEVENE
jgi:hypothetical protein